MWPKQEVAHLVEVCELRAGSAKGAQRAPFVRNDNLDYRRPRPPCAQKILPDLNTASE